mmetsp:Transcript_14870/g.41801  ORF Transcript_14870/g.41801 Transcript_14870/m.41801 type:complete len:180 (+) Transcript_14870:300-839(+)|eukprot:CAMPEP_0117680156 /NCGR_PEP_ID=MMETSP0804-20121206/18193_1 /TAXON_ID=1074897 /ORGANISM="Tetraselmis astigmatica, Strain CCMP880" /LENGTH=179 /DNA_ID=CAMNT_0005489617 /DNA_START=229 /DNA_END=768 /DNA_ORIENTATION=+
MVEDRLRPNLQRWPIIDARKAVLALQKKSLSPSALFPPIPPIPPYRGLLKDVMIFLTFVVLSFFALGMGAQRVHRGVSPVLQGRLGVLQPSNSTITSTRILGAPEMKQSTYSGGRIADAGMEKLAPKRADDLGRPIMSRGTKKRLAGSLKRKARKSGQNLRPRPHKRGAADQNEFLERE